MCFRLRLRPETARRRKVFKPSVGSVALRVNTCDIVRRDPELRASNAYAPQGTGDSSVDTVTTDRFKPAETSAQFERKSPSKWVKSRLIAHLRWTTWARLLLLRQQGFRSF